MTELNPMLKSRWNQEIDEGDYFSPMCHVPRLIVYGKPVLLFDIQYHTDVIGMTV